MNDVMPRSLNKNVVKSDIQPLVKCDLYLVYDTSGNYVIINALLELAEGGDLNKLYKSLLSARPKRSLGEQGVAYYIKRILLALKTIHGKDVVHRDLKPYNVLLTKSGRPLVADFGLACQLRKDENGKYKLRNSSSGSPTYMAPQVMVDGKPKSTKLFGVIKGEYGFDADMFSVGVMTYKMLYGAIPGLPGKYPTTYYMDFVNSLLERRSEKRLTVGQALEHLWLTLHPLQDPPYKAVYKDGKLHYTNDGVNLIEVKV
ncbi:protein kinase domain-containing protein [Ditylenchus destructor]|uniref:Protein kinase domain-containing protein n=1 Tax=Ditylenchus destructor TaxID=166010 RepID=A0AAD4ML44_9BILA|nr:protein kinase domain-containing protein [Ditylenchus destructor]